MTRPFVFRHIERHSAEALTRSKHDALADLARRWQRARAQYVREYWHHRHAAAVIGSPRNLREERRRIGWAAVPMSVAHHQTAFLSAMDVLRATWNSRLALLAQAVLRDETLSAQERSWTLSVLRRPQLLQMCLDGGVPDVQGLTTAYSEAVPWSRRLRRRALRSRGRCPRPIRSLWFEADTALYRVFDRPTDRFFHGRWIALGVGAGRRLCVPLAGREPLLQDVGGHGPAPSIRVRVGARVRFDLCVRVPPAMPSGDVQVGVDKGYRTLLTVSSGDASEARTYGERASMMIGHLAEEEIARQRGRRRLAAYERSLRNSVAARARRIRRRSLGVHKISRRTHRQRSQLRSEIGHALNLFFRSESRLQRIYCERLDLRATGLSRRMNRRLGRWLWGYLQRRLEHKAELNGVELKVVNAAFTSQTCPLCWFASKSNRQDDMFLCSACGYTGSSDAVAATNVLARGSDAAITRFTPVPVVKHILDERWRSARSGRAWGLSDGEPDDRRRRSAEQTVESREQPPEPPAIHQGSANRPESG